MYSNRQMQAEKSLEKQNETKSIEEGKIERKAAALQPELSPSAHLALVLIPLSDISQSAFPDAHTSNVQHLCSVLIEHIIHLKTLLFRLKCL